MMMQGVHSAAVQPMSGARALSEERQYTVGLDPGQIRDAGRCMTPGMQ